MFHRVIGDVLPVKIRQESTNDMPTDTHTHTYTSTTTRINQQTAAATAASVVAEGSRGAMHILYRPIVIKSQIKIEHGRKHNIHSHIDVGIKYRTYVTLNNWQLHQNFLLLSICKSKISVPFHGNIVNIMHSPLDFRDPRDVLLLKHIWFIFLFNKKPTWSYTKWCICRCYIMFQGLSEPVTVYEHETEIDIQIGKEKQIKELMLQGESNTGSISIPEANEMLKLSAITWYPSV